MQIPCQKGCGRFIEVTMEQMVEIERLGVPAKFEHYECETEPLSEYRVEVVFLKTANEGKGTPEVLARMGVDENSTSLSNAFNTLESGVVDALDKVRGLLDIIEVDSPLSDTTNTEQEDTNA
ncbi:MAG: hypothetical protein WBO55_10315 [Rhizobiaceae bacterium]